MRLFENLLFFGISAVAADFFTDHLKKHINRSINPCDDFYSHVCPPNLEDSVAGRHGLENVIDGLYMQYFAHTSENAAFTVASMKSYENQLSNNVQETRNAVEIACSNGTTSSECQKAEDFAHAATQQLEEFREKTGNLYEIYSLVPQFQTYVNVLSTSQGKRAIKHLKAIRNSVSEHFREKLRKTAWILKHEAALDKWIKQVDEINDDIPVEEASAIVEQAEIAARTYRLCMEKNETNSFEHLIGCLPTFHRDISPAELSDIYHATFHMLNAGSNPEHHEIHYNFPVLLTLTLDSPFAMVSVAITVGHETAHQFIVRFDSTLIDSPAQTNQTTCVIQTKDWICEKHHKGEECHEGSGTFQEDFADMVGSQLVSSVLEELLAVLGIEFEARNSVFPWMTNAQRIFYNLAAARCEAGGTGDNTDVHSRDRDRIYFMLSQNAEFKKVFGCPDDSPMFNPEIGICHIFGEEAPPYKNKNVHF